MKSLYQELLGLKVPTRAKALLISFCIIVLQADQKYRRSGRTVYLKPVEEEILGHRVGLHEFDATHLLDETLHSKAESMKDSLLTVPLGKMTLTVRRLMDEYHDRMGDLIRSQVTTRKERENGGEVLKKLKQRRDELERTREEQIMKIEDFYKPPMFGFPMMGQ